MFRNLQNTNRELKDLKLKFPDLEVSAFRVLDDSKIRGKTISEAKLRAEYGITLISMNKEKGDDTILNPPPDTIIEKGDLLYVMGTPSQIACALTLFVNNKKQDC